MAGVNKVILVGNLGRDPELRFTPNGGQPVANFTLATSESFNNKSGEREERTEWHRIVVWGKTAEHCANYLAKGRQVYIEGKLQTREWEDKDGQKRYTTEVVAQNMRFVGGRGGAGGASPAGQGFERGADDQGAPVGADDLSDFGGSGGDDSDIPF